MKRWYIWENGANLTKVQKRLMLKAAELKEKIWNTTETNVSMKQKNNFRTPLILKINNPTYYINYFFNGLKTLLMRQLFRFKIETQAFFA